MTATEYNLTEDFAGRADQYVRQELQTVIDEQLGRVAVLHDRPDGRLVDGEPLADSMVTIPTPDSASSGQVSVRMYRIDRAMQPVEDMEPLHGTDSPEKHRVLATLRSSIQLAAAAHHEQTADGPVIRWLDAANTLIGLASRAGDERQRDDLLVSAAVAGFFAPESADRLAFVRTVYEHGMNQAVADACRHSPLQMLHDEFLDRDFREPQWAGLTPLQDMAAGFELAPEDAARYLDAIEGTLPPASPDVTPKRLQKQLRVNAETGQVEPVTQVAAEHASLTSKDVSDVMRDGSKIERFALRAMFIKAQRLLLVGERETEGSLGNAPLAVALRERRGEPSSVITASEAMSERGISPGDWHNSELGRLISDYRQLVVALSQPAIEQFATDRQPEDGYEGLTKAQAADVRFRELVQRTNRQHGLASFIDLQSFITHTGRRQAASFMGDMSPNVWNAVIDGAAETTSDAAAKMIKAVTEAAYRDCDEDDLPSPQELHDLLQANRRNGFRTATQNIEDNDLEGGITSGNTTIKRDPTTHRLQATAIWGSNLHDDDDAFAAITLGCPALREILPNRNALTEFERLSHGDANYIDHLLAAVIREAYERGLLDLSIYNMQPDAPRQPAA